MMMMTVTLKSFGWVVTDVPGGSIIGVLTCHTCQSPSSALPVSLD